MKDRELIIEDGVTEEQLACLTPAERDGIESDQAEPVTDVPRLIELLKERERAYREACAELTETHDRVRMVREHHQLVEDDLQKVRILVIEAIRREALEKDA
ncbi:hypothetical protein D3C76_47920 [compost metagenome]